jgi:hypothetical protein
LSYVFPLTDCLIWYIIVTSQARRGAGSDEKLDKTVEGLIKIKVDELSPNPAQRGEGYDERGTHRAGSQYQGRGRASAADRAHGGTGNMS